MQKILVTGGAGFIGSHLVDRLLSDYEVVMIDDFNNYYDPRIKERNIKNHSVHKNYRLYKVDIRDLPKLEQVFGKEKPAKIVHLAARAGIRASGENPKLYFDINVLGTKNLLDMAVKYQIGQFILGSSSSVYGNTRKLPFSEDNLNLKPISPYGASKLAAEKLCASYHHAYQIPMTIFRFFTVYGPRGRPDMAPSLFTKAILEGKPIKKFGQGDSQRDYTYVADIVEGITLALQKHPISETINLGNSQPVSLNYFIALLEKIIGKKARIIETQKQQGDAEKTFASIQKAKKILGWQPKTGLEEGLKTFIDWFKTI